MISDRVSHKISNMGLLAALMVVMIHTVVPSGSAWGRFYEMAIIDGLCRLAVPFFFVVSGYMLARHYGELNWWRTQMMKRVKGLGIPFLACNMLAIALLIGLTHFGWSTRLSDKSISWMVLNSIGLYPLDWPAYAPLWYVRSLLLYVLVSPVLFSCIDRHSRCTMGVVAIGYIGLMLFESGDWAAFCYQFVSFSGLFWFSVGSLMSIKNYSMGGGAARLSWAFLLVALIIFGTLALLAIHGITAVLLNKVAIIAALFGLWGIMPSILIPSFLARAAFPIYILHMFVVWPTEKLARTIKCPSLLYFVFVVLMTLAMVYVLRRFGGKFSEVLFGGR